VSEDVANSSVPVVPGCHARFELDKKALRKAEQRLKGKIIEYGE
jgi:hypothetical protein